jgi:hypothetical protein
MYSDLLSWNVTYSFSYPLFQLSLKCRAPEVTQYVYQVYDSVLKNWTFRPSTHHPPLHTSPHEQTAAVSVLVMYYSFPSFLSTIFTSMGECDIPTPS